MPTVDVEKASRAMELGWCVRIVPLDSTECATYVPLGVIECAPKGGRAPLDVSRRQRLTMAVPLGRYPAGETKPVSMVM